MRVGPSRAFAVSTVVAFVLPVGGLVAVVPFPTPNARIGFAVVVTLIFGLVFGTYAVGAKVATFGASTLDIGGASIPYASIEALATRLPVGVRPVSSSSTAAIAVAALVAPVLLTRWGPRHWLVYRGQGGHPFEDEMADADPPIQAALTRKSPSSDLCALPIAGLLIANSRFAAELAQRAPKALLPSSLKHVDVPPMTPVAAAAIFGPFVLAALIVLAVELLRH